MKLRLLLATIALTVVLGVFAACAPHHPTTAEKQRALMVARSLVVRP